MNIDFHGRCPGCMQPIGPPGPGGVPMCTDCYDEFMQHPVQERMARITEFRRLGVMDDLVIQLEKLVQESKSWKGLDTRWSES